MFACLGGVLGCTSALFVVGCIGVCVGCALGAWVDRK